MLVLCARSTGRSTKGILAQLTPDKADIYVAAPQFQSITDRREPVYGTPYTLKLVDAATTKAWAGWQCIYCLLEYIVYWNSYAV